MSHIGKKIIPIPAGVTVSLKGDVVMVKGPKGELQFRPHALIDVVVKDATVVCAMSRSNRQAQALWGTTRARIANMIEGVTAGYRKGLELQGVGYRAAVKQGALELFVGYSHPVVIPAPAGISFVVEKEQIKVEGIDKELVGQVAADVRAVRKPEPYKGKGIRYAGELVRRKVGKVVGTTT